MNALDPDHAQESGPCLVCLASTFNFDPDLDVFACPGEHYAHVLQAYGYGYTTS